MAQESLAVTKAQRWETWFRSNDAKAMREKLEPYRVLKVQTFGKGTSNELRRLLTFRNQSKSVHDIPVDQLRKELETMTMDQLCAFVKEDKEALEKQKSQLDEKRRHGWRRASTSVQDFAQTFDRFLAAYSGVVHLVGCVDSQYGNVASATLSLLFAVCHPIVCF